MKNTTLKKKIISLLVMLTMLIGMVPLSGIVSFAVDESGITLSESSIEIPYAKQEKIAEYIKENVTVSYSDGGIVPLEHITVEASDGVATVTVEGRDPETIAYTIGEKNLLDLYFDPAIEIKAMPEEINETILRDHVNAYAKFEYDNEDGYIVETIYDDDLYIDRIDTEQKLVIVSYENYTASIAYTEFVRPELTVGEPLDIVINFATVDNTYVNFTPEESGEYIFTSSAESDTKAWLYEEDGTWIAEDDDGGDGLQFLIETDLEAGKKYYLRVNTLTKEGDCEITVKKMCDEHIEGEQTCMGYLCLACGLYYGEKDPDNHTEENGDGYCDKCDAFAPNVVATVPIGEMIDVELPLSNKEAFVQFVPAESGIYVIRSYDTDNAHDPYLSVYSATGAEIVYNDDGGGDLKFYLEYEFEAGVTYYLGIYDRKDLCVATFSVRIPCAEHSPSDTVNCLGTKCSLCGEYYGESDDAHTYTDIVDCRGTFCSVCRCYSGEGNENHVLTGEATCLGTLCLLCDNYFGEAGDHTPYGDATCLGTLCNVCWRYYGETGDHVPNGDATCLGTLCNVCWEYYGEAGEHVPEGDADCHGILCNICWEYYGEPAYDHTDGDENNVCDVCDTVIRYNDIALGETEVPLVAYDYVYYKFTPTESGAYYFSSSSSYDPAISVYNENKALLGESDTTLDNNFYLEVELVAGETYYIEFYEYIANNNCLIIIKKLCDEHSLDIFIYDREVHLSCCSVCGALDDEYITHNYDESGKCVCGREQLAGIMIGTTQLTDGQYLDNNGNVSTTCPSGGYAYYEDGKLVLNNFILTVSASLEGSAEDTEEGINGIYSERDLTIELKGHSKIRTDEEDVIYILSAELIIEGNGTLEIYADGNYDGIDVNGKLTVNSGNLIIDAIDHGIEVDGETEINGGVFYIIAGDDGMDLDSLVINGGIFYIHAEDNGIDATEADIVINGGSFVIKTNDDVGIESDSGSIIINGGTFDINANDECIDGLDVTINGGRFALVSVYCAVIRGYDSLVFDNKFSNVNVDIYEEYIDGMFYIVVDEFGEIIYDINISADEKIVISAQTTIKQESLLFCNGEEQKLVLTLINSDGEALVEGVDYTVTYMSESVKELGKYFAIINGIGDYTGAILYGFCVNECHDIDVDDTVKVNATTSVGDYGVFLKFTAEVTATHIFRMESENNVNARLFDGQNNIIVFGAEYVDGYVVITCELEAGKTYYLNVLSLSEISEVDISVEMICPGHTGGTATYREQAVCELCGDRYGEIIPCDHMCHKDGVYAIIWLIFERVYDYLGIETECNCGVHH